MNRWICSLCCLRISCVIDEHQVKRHGSSRSISFKYKGLYKSVQHDDERQRSANKLGKQSILTMVDINAYSTIETRIIIEDIQPSLPLLSQSQTSQSRADQDAGAIVTTSRSNSNFSTKGTKNQATHCSRLALANIHSTVEDAESGLVSFPSGLSISLSVYHQEKQPPLADSLLPLSLCISSLSVTKFQSDICPLLFVYTH